MYCFVVLAFMNATSFVNVVNEFSSVTSEACGYVILRCMMGGGTAAPLPPQMQVGHLLFEGKISITGYFQANILNFQEECRSPQSGSNPI